MKYTSINIIIFRLVVNLILISCCCRISTNETVRIQISIKTFVIIKTMNFTRPLHITEHVIVIHSNTLRNLRSLNMSTFLKSLHWLAFKVRNTLKTACLYYDCHSSTAPSYVADMLQRKQSHTRNTRSCSNTIPLLNRAIHSKATPSNRSFSCDSSLWSDIPISSVLHHCHHLI